MSDPDSLLLGRLAVHYKLITPQQASETLRVQGRAGETRRFGEILVSLGYLTPEKLQWLITAKTQYEATQKSAQQGGGATSSASSSTAQSAASSAAAQRAASVSAASSGSTTAQAASSGTASAHAQTSGAQQTPQARAAAQRSAASGAIGPRSQAMEVLTKAVGLNASDIHIHASAVIQVRVGGALRPLVTQAISPEMAARLTSELLDESQRKRLETHNEVDFALTVPGLGRFRGNAYKQQRGVDMVLRAIPDTPPTLEQLGLPSSLARLTSYHQGLVLLTGPAGCGKSSTLAALVNLINEDRDDHIITVEDPIEYVHTSKRCVVNQREVGRHTKTFAAALRAALREDPDVIVIGELRDLETVQLAISAAETGHLVLASLHTNSAVRTINRVLDVFPPDQQPQIRAMVSESLKAVVSQRLVPTVDGNGRVVACEILFMKPAISNLIRDEKTFQIRSIMQTARNEGTVLLDDSLLELVKAGQVTKDVARRFAEDQKRFA